MPTFGPCPDLIRASSLRCRSLHRSMPHWTAGTGPGSEPKGVRPGHRASLPLVGRDTGRGVQTRENAPFRAHALLLLPPIPAFPHKGGRGSAVPPHTGSCPDLIRASNRRCHLLRQCLLHWTAGSSPVVSPRGEQGRTPNSGSYPGFVPGIQPEVPHAAAFPHLDPAHARWHDPARSCKLHRGRHRPRQMAAFSCLKNVDLFRGQCAHVQGASLKAHWLDLRRVCTPGAPDAANVRCSGNHAAVGATTLTGNIDHRRHACPPFPCDLQQS